VRRALAAVVDRRAVTATCYSNPLAFEARALLPAMIRQNLGFGFEGTITYDPGRAGRLLAEAGARPPAQPLRLLVIPLSRPYLPDPPRVAARVAQCFADIGWRVDVDLRPNLAEYSARAAEGAYDMALQGWQPDSLDPVEYVASHLWSARVPAKPQDIAWAGNLARYRNPVLDKAIETHRAERDPRSWDEIQHVLVNDMPLLPIMYGASVVMLSWRVTRRSEAFLYRPLLAELAI
jgi:ABC-type oligopeptide transport system substrate-binding subunit